MVPKGNIWQYYRGEALKTIIEGVRINYEHPLTIHTWRRLGAYTVPGITQKVIKIEAYTEEIASALLGDIELLLDQALEQQAALYSAAAREDSVSPGWLIVTTYYWCFFCNLAMSRMTGKAHIHLTDEQINKFKKVAPSGGTGKNPGAGSFRLTQKAPVGINQTEIYIEKLSDVIHKAAWRDLIEQAKFALSNYGNSSANLNEHRLFACLGQGLFARHPEWPSSFRNAINYRPGVGYREVRNVDRINIVKFLQERSFTNLMDVITCYESEARNFRKTGRFDDAIDSNIDALARLLYLTALLLMSICSALYEELEAHRNLDKRWNQRRILFSKRTGILKDNVFWPYAGE